MFPTQLLQKNRIKILFAASLMFFSSIARSNITIDAPSIAVFTTASVKAIQLQVNIAKVNTKIGSANVQARYLDQKISNIDTQLKQNAKDTLAWRNEHQPNTSYNKVINDLYDALKVIDQKNTSRLEQIEEKSFNNDDALKNTVNHYGQGGLAYSTAIKGKAICPPSNISVVPSKDTYVDLQASSCIIMYNTQAYKSELIKVTRLKHDEIEAATDKLLKLKDKTIGDLNSKKDALTAIQFFRRKIIYEYQIGMEKADTQREIANDTRQHAGSALVGGAPTSPRLAATMALAKTGLAAAFVLTNAGNMTPYNQ